MTPDVVADVGNSRLKWGRCRGGAVESVVSLPLADPARWEAPLAELNLLPGGRWVLAGSNPPARATVLAWLERHRHPATLLTEYTDLPLRVGLDRPAQVGLDRLFDAVAANSRRTAGAPAVIIDAGTAVTVDCVDATGTFRGGAILPGLRLMTQSLHDYTARLPLVDITSPAPTPGTDTVAAIRAGVFWTLIGGVTTLLTQLSARGPSAPDVFLTGGDAGLLAPALGVRVRAAFGHDLIVWPEMTLEGIRLSAEALP